MEAVKGDLERLIEAVEAGKWDSRTSQPSKETGLHDWVLTIDEIMDHGSLDAALRLHEALLPGTHWSVEEDEDFGFCGRVYFNGWHHEHSTTPARAFLLAILRALAMREEG
jgi:hypothetical protein